MSAVATFVYADWIAAYPEFSTTVPTSGQAQNYFNLATIYWRNDGRGPVQDVTQQTAIMYLLTSHMAFLAVGTNNGPSAASQGLVGRVSSASQGSVSLSTDAAGIPGSAAWFAQSPYGFSFWQATIPFRLGGHYRPGPQRYFGVGIGRR
jgi:Protein of unknown function (DUF4054)